MVGRDIEIAGECLSRQKLSKGRRVTRVPQQIASHQLLLYDGGYSIATTVCDTPMDERVGATVGQQ